MRTLLASLLVFATFLSFVFFLGRKIKNFFLRMHWEEDDYWGHPYRNHYRRRPQLPVWKGDMLVDYPMKQSDYIPDHRIIEVQ